jgi:hypothetical protein
MFRTANKSAGSTRATQKATQRKVTTKKAVKKVATKMTKTTKRSFSATPEQATTTTTTTTPTTQAPKMVMPEEIDLLAEAPIVLTQKELGLAAYQGDLLKLKECFGQVEPKLNVNFKDHYGQTPLIHAIKNRHVKTMQYLIKNGADINLVDDQKKYPPFFHAIRKNSVSIFRTFLQNQPKTHVTIRGNKTALTIAAEHGAQVTILNDLLDMGFNIEHRDAHGKTPLMYAVLSSTIKEVEWWLNQGADPITRDKSGKCALDYALTRRNESKIYRLVQTRANELRRIRRLDNADENNAVKDALAHIDAQVKQQRLINNPQKVKEVVSTAQ